ncbi:phosphate acetyltransferase [Aquimarina sp. ERC-38]|uniref:phosphate acetyltransferase n=1 Tax=Aquimarina sp. ERC-38 TaxID=2949996 RepID=UPI002246C8C2|nr:phosphate acetyltransferase [Aquimarina sp. ERC-38]UZO79888.1 phosphate acetyltransferase [Aquimarina sp. ERC-38]
MNKAVYVATIEPNSGKSLVVLGLMQVLLGSVAKVGYFKPIIDDPKDNEVDEHTRTVVSYFELDINYKKTFAFTRSEILQKYNEGKSGEVIDTIIRKYKALEDQFDFILLEGTDFSEENNIIEFDVNVIIAKNLGIPAILIANGTSREANEITANLKLAYDTFKGKDVDVLAVIANKVSSNIKEELETALHEGFAEVANRIVVPRITALEFPTIKEITEALGGTVLFGKEFLNNQAGSFGVGAMQLRNYLTHLKENSLVVTPGDRADIILGALQANMSDNYPKVSGIILTGGLIPEEPILKLIEGVSPSVPIISVNQGTFLVTNQIGNIKTRIYADNLQKIDTSINTFKQAVDIEKLLNPLITFKSDSITPSMFQYTLLKRALQQKKHIVLPEGSDERILRAAAKLQTFDVVDLTLIGQQRKIKAKAAQLDIPLDFDRITILNPTKSEYYKEYVKTFYELRKHKGVNMDMAYDLMSDVSYFGTMMIYSGHADGMVSGAVHTTQHTIRPALQFIKTKPGVNVVSSVFFMCLEDRVSVFGDCAINPNPNAEQLAEIAISSANSAEAFGIEPKIAMLSYSSGSSGKGEDVETVRQATEMVKIKRPDLKIEGPIQYDAAVDLRIGKSKLPDSEVAGQASVLIFPDLNTGNNTYKAVQRETGALAIGPMLQGLNKPVNDLSRGCTVNDVYNTVIITAIQAQDM